MKSLLGLFLIVFMVGCEGKEGPMGPQGPQGPRGETAPEAELDDLKRRLAAAEAQLDLIFGGQEPQPLNLGETQLRFINGFYQPSVATSFDPMTLRGEIENYGDFDAVDVWMFLRFRGKPVGTSDIGTAVEEGWYEIGTIRKGTSVLFNIITGWGGKVHNMDYQFLYSEGGEAKIGGEGNIQVGDW